MIMQYRPISLLRKIVRDDMVASTCWMYQAIRPRPVDPGSACKEHPAALANGHRVLCGT